MDFAIPESIRPLVAQVRAFVEQELFPLEPAFLNGAPGELAPVLAAKRAQVKAAGWWAPFLPTSLGGMGLSLVDYAHISEQLGRSPLGHYVFNCQAPDVGNMEVLHAFGTPAQQEQYLLPLARGEIRSCYAMTEPANAGSNPVLMDTKAVEEGDDYVINGHKWFTTGADGAAFAIVMAITHPDAPSRHKRASQILVPTDTPGYELVRNISVMGEPGSGHASHGEVRFTDVRVPKQNRLGPAGEGFAIAQERLGPGRIHHCMRWIGIAERCLDLLCRHALGRRLSTHGYLADQQTIHNWIAESRAEIDAARLLVLSTAWKMDREGAKAARTEVSTIKFFVAGMLQAVMDRAIQTHGALGVTDDTPLSHWYRHERAARIYDGPDEVHKWVVARQILGSYREARAEPPSL